MPVHGQDHITPPQPPGTNGASPRHHDPLVAIRMKVKHATCIAPAQAALCIVLVNMQLACDPRCRDQASQQQRAAKSQASHGTLSWVDDSVETTRTRRQNASLSSPPDAPTAPRAMAMSRLPSSAGSRRSATAKFSSGMILWLRGQSAAHDCDCGEARPTRARLHGGQPDPVANTGDLSNSQEPARGRCLWPGIGNRESQDQDQVHRPPAGSYDGDDAARNARTAVASNGQSSSRPSRLSRNTGTRVP